MHSNRKQHGPDHLEPGPDRHHYDSDLLQRRNLRRRKEDLRKRVRQQRTAQSLGTRRNVGGAVGQVSARLAPSVANRNHISGTVAVDG